MEITTEIFKDIAMQNDLSSFKYIYIVKKMDDDDKFDELYLQNANKYYDNPYIFRKHIRIYDDFDIYETEYTFNNKQIYKIKVAV